MAGEKSRFGKIILGGPTIAYQEFRVEQTPDGQTLYYLGSPARTRDGWVHLSPELISRVLWDEPETD